MFLAAFAYSNLPCTGALIVSKYVDISVEECLSRCEFHLPVYHVNRFAQSMVAAYREKQAPGGIAHAIPLGLCGHIG